MPKRKAPEKKQIAWLTTTRILSARIVKVQLNGGGNDPSKEITRRATYTATPYGTRRSVPILSPFKMATWNSIHNRRTGTEHGTVKATLSPDIHVSSGYRFKTVYYMATSPTLSKPVTLESFHYCSRNTLLLLAVKHLPDAFHALAANSNVPCTRGPDLRHILVLRKLLLIVRASTYGSSSGRPFCPRSFWRLCKFPNVSSPSASVRWWKHNSVRHTVLVCIMPVSVYIYGEHFQQSMDQPGKVDNPARGQLNRRSIFSLSPFVITPESSLILLTRTESGAYSRGFSRFLRQRPINYTVYRQPPSSQSLVYDVMQLRTDGVHCRTAVHFVKNSKNEQTGSIMFSAG